MSLCPDYVSFFQTIYEVLMKIAFEFIDIPKKLYLATFHHFFWDRAKSAQAKKRTTEINVK